MKTAPLSILMTGPSTRSSTDGGTGKLSRNFSTSEVFVSNRFVRFWSLGFKNGCHSREGNKNGGW